MKLIDKELNMWSCTPDELTYRQICILKQDLGEDSKLSDFESFFDDKTGQLIMNKEHKDFDFNVDGYSKYLKATDEEKIAYKDKHKDNAYYLDLFEYLDFLNTKIEDFKMLKILGYQPINWNVPRLWKKMNSTDPRADLMAMYNYGLIQGKRIERARRSVCKEVM
ncbi:MAG: hypothetical protein V8S74_06335 [Lachnospirales bacterium]